jgi:hypothetical protein
MKRFSRGTRFGIVVGTALCSLVLAAVLVFLALSHSSPPPSPSDVIESYLDKANLHDAPGMLNCTIFRFESQENLTKEVDSIREVPWFSEVSFNLTEVGIVNSSQMNDLDRMLAGYDIQSKSSALSINITDYCLASFRVTRTCIDSSLVPILGLTKVLSINIYCYKVGSSWYLSDLPDIYT